MARIPMAEFPVSLINILTRIKYNTKRYKRNSSLIDSLSSRYIYSDKDRIVHEVNNMYNICAKDGKRYFCCPVCGKTICTDDAFINKHSFQTDLNASTTSRSTKNGEFLIASNYFEYEYYVCKECDKLTPIEKIGIMLGIVLFIGTLIYILNNNLHILYIAIPIIIVNLVFAIYVHFSKRRFLEFYTVFYCGAWKHPMIEEPSRKINITEFNPFKPYCPIRNK